MEINKYMVKAKLRNEDKWIYGYTIGNGIVNVNKSNIWDVSTPLIASAIEWTKKDTICRPTMLLDKNGNVIWENDVVKLHYFYQSGTLEGSCEEEMEMVGIVVYDDECFAWGITSLNEKEEDIELFAYLPLHEESVEVIGNIYDNPELLQTQDDLKEIIEGD
jgi:phage uncharacterized protein TIGR01671